MAKKVDRREVQQKLLGMMQYLQESGLLIADREDMEVNGEPQPAALILGTAACSMRNVVVSFVGPPGTAKTSYMKLLGRYFAGEDIPIMPGHPEQTEEKMIARPKINKKFLEDGLMDPNWTNWVNSIIKGIDEVNGLPPRVQGLLQRYFAEGKFDYSGVEKDRDGDIVLTTMNPSGERTFPLDDAFKDRLMVTVPFYTPTSGGLKQIRERPDKRMGESSKYKELVEKMGSLTREEFDALPRFVGQTELDPDAGLFIDMLVQELSYCKRAEKQDKGQGRIAPVQICGVGGKGNECEFGGDTGYVCKRYRQAASPRVEMDMSAISKATAFVLGEERADIRHVKAVAKYVIAGRLAPVQATFEVAPYYGNNVLRYADDVVEEVSKRFEKKKEIMTNYGMDALTKRYGKGQIDFEEVRNELEGMKDPLAREYIMVLEQIRKHDVAEDAAAAAKA